MIDAISIGIGEADMDGGPFRSQRPAERRVASRPEPAYRQPDEPQPVSEAPKPVHRAPAPRHAEREEKKLLKRLLWPIIIVVIVLLGAVGWFAWSNMGSTATGIESSKYQAVFFANGQIYFGKLQAFNGGYMKLTDIFYLQSQQSADSKDAANPQATSSDQSGNNLQLIKLGDEIHGPEDEMIISKDQVLYYENLKTDGKVAQSIKKFKDSK
jgi:hypothetical protein